MTGRTRSRTRRGVSPGSYGLYSKTTGALVSGPNYGGSGAAWHEVCTDSTQPRPFIVDQPLLIENYNAEALRISGVKPWSVLNGYEWRFDGYNPPNRSLYSYCPAPVPINWPFWVTKALANMNPSRPAVDIQLFLFELKDFPGMLKDLGDALVRRRLGQGGPKDHLAYSFGWAPLVSDVLSLLKLQKSIESRIAYLRALENGARVRQTLAHSEILHANTPNGFDLAIDGASILTCDVLTTERIRVWFTANAKLVNPLPAVSLTPKAVELLLLGAIPSGSTLWEAIPWSFLVDYFANIGDYMAATRGWIPWVVSRLNIMATQQVESTLTRKRHFAGFVSSGGRLQTTLKHRHVESYPWPVITNDPFLSGGQIAIMSSLLTVKALGQRVRGVR